MKPRVGDTVEHVDMNGTHQGTVDQLLSAQFVYVTEEGTRRMCLFNEEWKIVRKRKFSRAEFQAKLREKKQRRGACVPSR